MSESLKLYRVVVYTHDRSITPKKEFIVLGYDADTACDLALTQLGLGNLRSSTRKDLKINEIEGPFEEGRILYCRSYNGGGDGSIIENV